MADARAALAGRVPAAARDEPLAGRASAAARHEPPVRLLFVCLGNICRSPTAEGVMRTLVRGQALERSVELESAGTGAWHVGSPPDARATQAARARGVALEGAARQVRVQDFDHFDLLLGMDRENLNELRRLAPGDGERAKVRLLREFDPASAGSDDLDVPDPYYGGEGGFDEVFELVHAACEGLLERLRDGLPALRAR